jgi:hypothetical protein
MKYTIFSPKNIPQKQPTRVYFVSTGVALDWPSTLFQLHWIDLTGLKSRPRIQLLDWNAYWIQFIPVPVYIFPVSNPVLD